MSDPHQSDREAINFTAYNESSLKELAWAITASVGKFKLLLARCNYTSLRERLVERLQKLIRVDNIRILKLEQSEKTLYARIQAELGEEPPDALMVCGLESVGDLDQLLSATNQVREEFRNNLHFPVVLWVTDEVLTKLLESAPDFESWATTTEFRLTTDQLVNFLKKKAEGLFEGNFTLTLAACREIQLAYQDLQSREQGLDLEILATIKSLVGFTDCSLHANQDLDKALKHYRQGAKLWEQSNNLARQGQTFICIAFCYYLKALQDRGIDPQHGKKSGDYIRKSLKAFEQAQRPDLVANSILIFGIILRELKEWEQLQTLAQKALLQHQIEENPIELAQDYGFLAEVALAKTRWYEAKEFVQKALQVLPAVPSLQSPHISGVRSELSGYVISYHPSRYWFIMGQSHQHLNQNQEAIRNLEEAKRVGSPEDDTRLYLDILYHLRELYFKQKEYLKAFELKLEQQSIEQQYGLRAFVGAGRIQPQRQAKSALTQGDSQETIAPEIAASGRMLDVDRLIQRIGSRDSKLIVIHGQSGVGKSALVNGGLVPELKHKTIGTSDVLPVSMHVYTNWVHDLRQLLKEAIEEKATWGRGGTETRGEGELSLDSEAAILGDLKQTSSRNLQVVMIFDQFEAFFFVYPDPAERRRFFELVGDCLEITPVKVILSLRQDYLPLLLEYNDLPKMRLIGSDLLSKNVLYPLRNFSPDDAKSIIQRLTEHSSFRLEPDLIGQLVQDLARESGDVRPIELQIVGAQLEADNITTIEQYKKKGSKRQLVQHFLEQIVKDCGEENERRVAQLVLYFLTDETGNRLLKKRAELLDKVVEVFPTEAEKLELVLNVLVESRIVFLITQSPSDYYQLVHDYFVSFIRQQYNELYVGLKIAEGNRQQEQAQRLKAEAEAQQLKAEKAEAEAQQLKAEAKAQQLKAEKAEAEAQQLKAEAKAQRLKAEAEAQRLKAEAEAQRLKAEAEAQQLKAEKAEAQRLEAEAEAQRLKAEAKAQRLKAEAKAQRLKAQTKAQQLKTVSVAGLGMAVLAAIAGGLGVKSAIGETNAQLTALASSSETFFNAHFHEEALRKSIEAGEKLQQTNWANWVEADTKIIVNTALRQAVYESFGKEIKTFKGHLDAVGVAENVMLFKLLFPNQLEFQVSYLPAFFTESATPLEAVRSVSFSPNGKMIASASEDKTVKLWDISSDKEPKTLQGHLAEVWSVSFSPNGKMIASASKDKTVKLWDVSTSRPFKTLKGHSSGVRSVSFSPNGKMIASASEDRTVKLWNVFSDEEPILLKGNSFALWSVKFSPNGKIIASASSNGEVLLWDTSGNKLKPLSRHSSDVWDISFSPDGKTIASVSRDGTVKLWNTSSGEELKTLTGHSSFPLWSVSFSPDSKMIAATSWDGKVIMWDTYSGTEIKTLSSLRNDSQTTGSANEEQLNEIWSISFSPNGKTVASASQDGTVKLWDISTRELKTLKGHSAEVRNVSFSPNGKMIASVGFDETINKDGTIKKDGTIILWDTSPGKKPKILKGHSSEVWSVSFSPDSKMIASASWDGTVKLWDTSSGRELKIPPLKSYEKIGHSAEVWSVSFSPDGKTIASASSDKTVKLWDVSSGAELKTLQGHTAEVRSVSFSPDGKTIASASSDKTVKLWDVSSGKELKTLPLKGYEKTGHTAEVWSVSFSPDGKTIASASEDTKVKLWDVSSGTELNTLQGHSKAVRSVSFSPDGKTIASASSDKTVKLWDVSSGTELTTLKGHSGEVKSVSFSPDGKMIASASDDKTVIVWNLDTDNLLSLGCRLKDSLPQPSKTFKEQHCHQTQKMSVAAESAWIAQGKEVAPNSKTKTVPKPFGQKVPSHQNSHPAQTKAPFSCNPGSDPKSPHLFTYEVKPLDNRVGTGIRCVKFSDGGGKTIPSLAWYGEGRWGGKTYRHVGHAFYINGRLIGSASNIYGNGENINGNFNNLDLKIVNKSTISVKSREWNEEWKLVSSSKYEPLRMDYNTCGRYFVEYEVSDLRNSRKGDAGGLRCILPVGDLNTTWFGNGKWEDTFYTHLGTLSSKGYGADDICKTKSPFCNTFEYGLLKLTPKYYGFDVTGSWSEKWDEKNEKFPGR